MGDWAYLRNGTGPFPGAARVDAAPALLGAKNYVPTLWPALLDAGEIAAPADRLWYATRVSDALARLRALWMSAGSDPFFAAVWESTDPVIDWLASLDPASSLLVDIREVSALQPPGELRSEVAKAAAAFLDLRLRWSPEAARALLPRWLDLPEVGRAALAARRFARLDSPRGALFAAAFGWPDDSAVLDGRWQPWFAAGPAAPPLPPPLDEAERLAVLLDQRGLVAFADTPTAQKLRARYLAAALRDRRAETLIEVLIVMQQQGIVREIRGDASALADAMAALDTPAEAG